MGDLYLIDPTPSPPWMNALLQPTPPNAVPLQKLFHGGLYGHVSSHKKMSYFFVEAPLG